LSNYSERFWFKVGTVIDNANNKYGFEVPNVMEYGVRRKALRVVIGDDYLKHTKG
jgi:hypothetical protein